MNALPVKGDAEIISTDGSDHIDPNFWDPGAPAHMLKMMTRIIEAANLPWSVRTDVKPTTEYVGRRRAAE